MKICGKCKIEKNFDAFALRNDKYSKDGRASRCKECKNKENYDRRHKDIKKYNEDSKKRYYENKEQRHITQKKYYASIKDERRAKHKMSPIKELLCHAKARAKKRNLIFDLEVEDILIPELCPILDIPLFVGKEKRINNSPTIDRIDNTKGYTKNNIIVVSWRANRLKSDASLEELIRLSKFYIKLGEKDEF